MLPSPPSWAPHATVEESRIPGEFTATVPKKVEGVAVLTQAEMQDPREFENRLTELMNGRTRPVPKGCGLSARAIVGFWRNGYWERPNPDTPIEILTVGL